jgi:hypothetical protein
MTPQSSHGEKLVLIEGPAGPFEIAFAGRTSERHYKFHYRDDTHDFYFFAGIETRPFWKIKVMSAVTGPSLTTIYKASAEREQSLRTNLEYFFKRRFAIRPDEPLEPGSHVLVNFEWKIA